MLSMLNWMNVNPLYWTGSLPAQVAPKTEEQHAAPNQVYDSIPRYEVPGRVPVGDPAPQQTFPTPSLMWPPFRPTTTN